MKVVVLASGRGSNAAAVMDAADELGVTVAAVVTNNPDAPVLQRAADREVRGIVVERLPDERRAAYDLRLAAAVTRIEPDLVVLAGWMRILTRNFVSQFPVINLHPALPGQLAGAGAIERAYDEFVDGQRTHTGVMVHWVPDEAVDAGPVIVSEVVAIEPDDTLDSLSNRIHDVEHRLLPHALAAIVDNNDLEVVNHG